MIPNRLKCWWFGHDWDLSWGQLIINHANGPILFCRFCKRCDRFMEVD